MLRFQAEDCLVTHMNQLCSDKTTLHDIRLQYVFQKAHFIAVKMEKCGPQTALTAWHYLRPQLQSGIPEIGTLVILNSRVCQSDAVNWC